MKELTFWLDSPEPARFPYDAVMGEYLRVGKHFVSHDLLEALAADALPYCGTYARRAPW